jgi:hypothetical protein
MKNRDVIATGRRVREEYFSPDFQCLRLLVWNIAMAFISPTLPADTKLHLLQYRIPEDRRGAAGLATIH